MTARGFYVLIFGCVLMFTALSVGSQGAFLLGAAALIALALSLISVLCALFSCQLTQTTGLGQTTRGARCRYTLSVRLFSPVPIAPLSLRLCLPGGRQSDFVLPAKMIGTTASDNDFPCAHVGVFPVGVLSLTFADCFGLFALRHDVREPLESITVLPNPRDCAPLAFSPGEGETSAAQRAQADRTTPTDTRAWQDGDDLKRVHWKLSMRRQELMVHTYETPQRPDALVLLDCAAPQLPSGAIAEGAQRAALIDALTESAAGVLKCLLEARRPVRMPLEGERELSGQDGDRLPAMLVSLAQESFSRPGDLVRMLMLASRRMRRTGSTAILSTQLTPADADAVIALGRMGPRTRFVLVTSGEMSDTQQQLLHLLAASGIETEHVSA